MNAVLSVTNESPILEIVDEGVDLILDSREIALLSVGMQGPMGAPGATGATGPQGPPGPGGLDEVADDPSPELGGDLNLGSYNIIGQLENNNLILDGGLL